jgi:hypothetical protein
MHEVHMKLTHMVLLCLIPLATGAAPAPFALAQVQPAPNPSVSPNALDDQDRLRDIGRQRARDDIRARLGDPAPEPQRHRGYESPRTDHKPGVSDFPDSTLAPLPPR